MDQDGKILSHGTTFDGVDDDGFQRGTEMFEFSVVIKLSSVEETSSPSKDGGNRVGGGFLTLKKLLERCYSKKIFTFW